MGDKTIGDVIIKMLGKIGITGALGISYLRHAKVSEILYMKCNSLSLTSLNNASTPPLCIK